MKTIIYLLISLAIAMAATGCTSSTSNMNSNMSSFDRIDKAVYTEYYGESN